MQAALMSVRAPSSGIVGLFEKTARDSRDWDISAIDGATPRTIAFLNAHAVNLAARDPVFRDFLMGSDMLLRDGIGVKLALKWFGLGDTRNLNGTDLIADIILRHRHERLAIFGTSEEALAACRRRLVEEGADRIVATEHGFHPDDFYLAAARGADPELVILCMGMPRQEKLAARLRESGLARVIVCGGGWADFYSGHKVRAPLWVRRLSLEWLHRLWREPRRLGRRYTIDIIAYFWLIMRARLSG